MKKARQIVHILTATLAASPALRFVVLLAVVMPCLSFASFAFADDQSAAPAIDVATASALTMALTYFVNLFVDRVLPDEWVVQLRDFSKLAVVTVIGPLIAAYQAGQIDFSSGKRGLMLSCVAIAAHQFAKQSGVTEAVSVGLTRKDP